MEARGAGYVPSDAFVRAEEHRHRRGEDPHEALLREIRRWIVSGPDTSTLRISKRGGSLKITAEINGNALDVLRELNNGRPADE
jgi:hypothetical protein